MNRKIASLLLICFVALAIVYGCTSIGLSSHETRSIDAASCMSTTVTEEPRQNLKLSYPEPNPFFMGDPIDDPVPHKQ